MSDIKRVVFSSSLYKDKENLAFRSTSVMTKALDEVAQKHGYNRSQLIVEVLEEFLQRCVERDIIENPLPPDTSLDQESD